MVDTISLSTHLESLRQALEDLRRYRNTIDEARFLADRDSQRMVVNALYQAAQACIDMGAHIVSDKSLGRPESYREIFSILAAREGLDPQICTGMERWAGLRNILAHMYWKMNAQVVYASLLEIDFLEEFGRFAAGYLVQPPGA